LDPAPPLIWKVIMAAASFALPGLGHFVLSRPVRGSAWFALFALSTVALPHARTIGFIGVFIARFGAALDLLVSRLTPPGPAELRRASWSTIVFVAVVMALFFYFRWIK